MTTNKLVEEKVKEFDEKRLPLVMSASPSWEGYIRGYHDSMKRFFKTSLNEVVEAREKEIYQDLMKVADECQYEDLRREVERYFKEINKKKETK